MRITIEWTNEDHADLATAVSVSGFGRTLLTKCNQAAVKADIAERRRRAAYITAFNKRTDEINSLIPVT